MRKLLFWMHFGLGLGAGLMILALAASGALLTLESPLTAALEARQRRLPGVAPGSRLALEPLLVKVQAAQPELRITGVRVAADPSRALELSRARGQVLYVDPYTGRVLGAGAPELRAAFRWLQDWHRWLDTTGPWRAYGRALTGAGTLALGLLALSGAVLWWPTRVTRATLGRKVLPQPGLRGRPRNFNWHNVAGFWSAWPLLLIVGTGAVMAYPWADALLNRAVGGAPVPARAERAPRSPEPGARGDAGVLSAATTRGLDACLERAQLQVAGWRTLSWRWPTPDDGRLSLSIESGDGTRPDGRGQLTFDRSSGTVLRWEPFAERDAGRRARAWARALHTGEAGGVLGQILAASSACVACLLVWTGWALAWTRLRNPRGRARGAAATRVQAEPTWDGPPLDWSARGQGGLS